MVQDRLIRREAVEERCGLSRDTIYRLMGEGLFPRPLQVGPRAVRWSETEIESWISARPRAGGRWKESTIADLIEGLPANGRQGDA